MDPGPLADWLEKHTVYLLSHFCGVWEVGCKSENNRTVHLYAATPDPHFGMPDKLYSLDI